jgi:hypothetical protein
VKLSPAPINNKFFAAVDKMAHAWETWFTQVYSKLTNLSHTEINDIGINTHSSIDTHIADTTIHFLDHGIDNVVEDLTPQLGGDLDVNGKKITSASNGNVLIYPNGSGNTKIGAASHYSMIDSSGHQTMEGDARPWRDQVTDALNLQRQGTGIAIDVTEGGIDFQYNAAYNATFTSSDAAFVNVQLNHDKDLASSIYPHIHWFQAKNYSPNFLFEYRWQINSGAKTTSWTKLVCNTLAHTYTSGTIHQISYASAISVPVGTTLSDIVQFRIYRDTTNVSGSFAGNCPYNTGGNASAVMLSFDVHFQINSIGSNNEYTK